MKMGFIGLGNIGGPMADRVAQADETTVFDVDRAARERFMGRASIANSPAEVGRQSKIVGICVRSDDDVRDVIEGPEGLVAGMAPGGTILVHSTIRPATVLRANELARGKGVEVLDAAISGGPGRAAAGTLVSMVGAPDADAFARAKLLVSAFSSEVIHAGPVGAGMVVKLCNNLVTYTTVVAAYEAFGLAEASGVTADALRLVMAQNGNLTEAMDLYYKGRLAAQRGELAATTASHAANLADKDLDLAIEVARETGWPSQTCEEIRRLMPRAFGS